MLINTDLVASLVADQFPQWEALPIVPVAQGGWDNRTFRLGSDKLVRLPSAEHYAPAIQTEQAWLPKLAPNLPIAIPKLLGRGKPSDQYPWNWSVYNWIEGGHPSRKDASKALATQLANFLTALQRIPSIGGPYAGDRNFHRGGDLSHYNDQTRAALARLQDQRERENATQVWDEALASVWRHDPVWVHGDFAGTNLLVQDGELKGVIDFGQLAVGDPACDLTIAWTLLCTSERCSFREAIMLDADTWARAKGWALWKALIHVSGIASGPPHLVDNAHSVLSAVLEDPAS
ncbi:MAG: aminoglycoside phosphotransferase family protein [Erythrobacter sp.]